MSANEIRTVSKAGISAIAEAFPHYKTVLSPLGRANSNQFTKSLAGQIFCIAFSEFFASLWFKATTGFHKPLNQTHTANKAGISAIAEAFPHHITPLSPLGRADSNQFPKPPPHQIFRVFFRHNKSPSLGVAPGHLALTLGGSTI